MMEDWTEYAPKECFVCKMPLIDGKCMAPTCPKNKDLYTLSREELLKKANPLFEYDPSKPDHTERDKDEEWLKEMMRHNPLIEYDPLKPSQGTFKGADGFTYEDAGGGVLIKSDGGPSTYFDLCNGGTLNDELERKGDEQWLGDSFHLGNVVKLAWRWGIKEGTDKAYDANKLIYSGARLLMKYKGVAAVRKSLQKLLDDPQFQEREKDK